MSEIVIHDLSFTYEGSYEPVFDHLNLRLDSDWKLGLIGRNGRGKTTLLKLMMHEYPYTGSIQSVCRFEYFPYEVKDTEDLSIHIVNEIAPSAEQWEMERELSLLKADDSILWMPFSSLSGGEKTKVLLAAMFLKENAFLLIDEPTNHLDETGRAAAAAYLNRKKGFILVSHDRAFLDACTDHTMAMNKTGIEVMQGSYSIWRKEKTARDQLEIKQNARLHSEIRRLEEGQQRTAKWSDQVEKSKIGARDKGYVGHMAAKMMQRSKNIERRRKNAITEKEGLLKDIEESESLKLIQPAWHSSVMVYAQHLSLYYGEVCIKEDLNFSIHPGDRIQLYGKNGCGKTTLLKLMNGQDIRTEGTIHLGSGLKCSMIFQDSSFMQGNLRSYADHLKIDISLFLAILRKLGFSREQFDRPLEECSEGQKKKIQLAGSLSQSAHLLLWDEPMNYLDIESREQIEDLILTWSPTIVFAEHDQYFSEKIRTGIIRF